MPTVVYELPDGSVHAVEVPHGLSVMDGSVRNNLAGIVAECGGSCSCATCHVYVDTGDFDEVSDEERNCSSSPRASGRSRGCRAS